MVKLSVLASKPRGQKSSSTLRPRQLPQAWRAPPTLPTSCRPRCRLTSTVRFLPALQHSFCRGKSGRDAASTAAAYPFAWGRSRARLPSGHSPAMLQSLEARHRLLLPVMTGSSILFADANILSPAADTLNGSRRNSRACAVGTTPPRLFLGVRVNLGGVQHLSGAPIMGCQDSAPRLPKATPSRSCGRHVCRIGLYEVKRRLRRRTACERRWRAVLGLLQTSYPVLLHTAIDAADCHGLAECYRNFSGCVTARPKSR
jgi:hypothetical protein